MGNKLTQYTANISEIKDLGCGKYQNHLGCSLVNIGGFSRKYTKLGSGGPQANDWGCVCDLDFLIH